MVEPNLTGYVNQSVSLRVKPEADAQVMAFYNQGIRAKEYAEARVITTVEDLKPASDDLIIIRQVKKAMEEKRKEYVKPPQDLIKAFNDTFKTLMAPIEEADRITGDKILAFQLKQKLIREEQERINALRLEAAQRDAALHNGEISESVNLIEVIAPAPKRVSTGMGAVTTTTIWKFEVINFSLLPDRFKIENATLIGKVVRAGEREIPGVKIWSENILRGTTK